MNRELAVLFGDCWHEKATKEMRENWTIGGPKPILSCPICGLSEMQYGNTPDYLTLVTVPCDGCGGSGYGFDINITESDETQPICPTCQGRKTRTISKLQQRMEAKGWWKKFKYWLYTKESDKVKPSCGFDLNDAYECYDDCADTFTDLQALGAKVIEWKGR